jgi:general secretion pathway protein F
MILLSHALRSFWPAFVLVFGTLGTLWLFSRLFLKTPIRRSLATRIPVVGKVWRYTSWAEFCHLLALLLETNLPLPDALRLTGEGIQNVDLDRACQVMAAEIERGRTLSEAMAAQVHFPTGLPRLLRWAQGHGAIAEILHTAGEMFEARARGQATFAGTVVAVLSIIFVLWGIFTVIIGLMLPMITLISRLSG